MKDTKKSEHDYIDENSKHVHLSENGCIWYEYSRYLDIDGNPVERDPDTYRYSHDFYVQWRGGENKEVNDVVYSDRLYQWDSKKYDKLMEKHFNNQRQIFYDVDPKKMESFLKDYMDDQELKLIVIMHGCNVGNRFPLWTFHYNYTKMNKK